MGVLGVLLLGFALVIFCRRRSGSVAATLRNWRRRGPGSDLAPTSTWESQDDETLVNRVTVVADPPPRYEPTEKDTSTALGSIWARPRGRSMLTGFS